MKRFRKVLISTLLVIAMVLTGMPFLPVFDGITNVFAGSSTEPEVDRDTHSTTHTQGDGEVEPNGYRATTANDTYILSVTMGSASDDVCQSIIIKYYADPEAKAAGLVSTQILKPDAGNDFGETLTSAYAYRSSKSAFLGSTTTSYTPFISNPGYSSSFESKDLWADNSIVSLYSNGGTAYVLNGKIHFKNFDKYSEWAFALNGLESRVKPAEDYKFASVPVKASSPSLKSYSTNNFRFTFEYGFYELVDLAFYCEPDSEKANSTFDFVVKKWVLYKHDGEYSADASFIPGATRIENFAFVSDSMAMSFNGTKLYESILYDKNDPETTKYPSVYSMGSQGCGIFTFKNVSEYENLEDYDTGFSQLYFFKECGGSDFDRHVSTSERTILNFGIHIAEDFGAGIESYLDDNTFKECLNAEITYVDNTGSEQIVGLPVITNALLEYVVPVDEDVNEKNEGSYISSYDMSGGTRYAKLLDKKYLAFAQATDTIYFSVEIPNFKSLTSMDLEFLAPDSDEILILESVDVYNNKGVSEYACRQLYTDNSKDAIDVSLNGCELIYKSTEKTNYISLDSYNNMHTFKFEPVNSANASQKKIAYTNKYLVTFNTAQLDVASTTEDVQVFFSYKKIGGAQTGVTRMYSLKEACRDFYGYNSCTVSEDVFKYDKTGDILKETGNDGVERYITETKTSKDENGQYYYNMYQGHSMQLIIDAQDVDHFTEMTLSFPDENAEDQWQISSMTIEKLKGETVIGKRVLSACDDILSVDTDNGLSKSVALKQIFTRSVDGTELIYKNDSVNLMVYKGKELTFNLEDSGVEIKTEDVVHDAEYKYSLDESMAAKDLKLGEPMVTYTVQVHVAGNEEALRDDNCGSNNLFYFQLLFASNGGTHTKSAFVQANQQLSADGFRSGKNEQFNISVNENVGDVVGINIIADDLDENADMFDKLNIEEIDVIKHNDNNINKCYVISNIGWLMQDYNDNAEKAESENRSASELQETFSVSYATYMLDLEFAITWGSYLDDSGKPLEGQFIGNLLADLNYRTSGDNATVATDTSIQVVQLMSEYMERTAISDSEITYRSNPKYMFQSGHTNRFLYSMKSVSQINSIRFTAYASNMSTANYIPFASMSVTIVTCQGNLLADPVTGDFMRNYPSNPDGTSKNISYCSDFGNAFPFKLSGVADAKGSGVIPRVLKFNNTADLTALDQTADIESLVGRVPASANDTLNVFIYMKPGTPSPTDANKPYPLQTVVYYSTIGREYITSVELEGQKIKNEVDSEGNKILVIYKEGIDASNMNALTDLTLKVPTIQGTEFGRSVLVDHAIVQQVRDNTVINTYRVNFSTQMVGLNKYGAAMFGRFSSAELGYEQNLTIQLHDDSMIAELIPEQFDIAARIKYRSLTDPSGNAVYSPYVFATDSGVTSVHPGSIIDFKFNEAYISEIEGIEVVAFNGLEVDCNSAIIKTYETGEDSVKRQTQLYSISTEEPVTIGKSKIGMDVTAVGTSQYGTLRRANLKFKIMEDSVAGIIDSAGTAPIRAELAYEYMDGTQKRIDIPDLRARVTDESTFTSGDTANVSLFIEGAKNLLYVKVQPYDADELSIASLNLESVSFQLDDSDDTSNRTMNVGKTIYENEAEIVNLSTIQIRLDVKYFVASVGNLETSVTNGTAEIIASEGSEVVITPTIGGGNAEYYARIYRVKNGIRTLVSSLGSNDPQFKFLAENGTTKDVEWLVEICSAQAESVKSYVKITVPVDE